MVQCGISTIHVHEFMAIEEDSRNIEDRFGTIRSDVDIVKNLLMVVWPPGVAVNLPSIWVDGKLRSNVRYSYVRTVRLR